MVHSNVTFLLLLIKLLAVTAKDKISVNCKDRKCNFGDPIEVSYKLDCPRPNCCNAKLTIYPSNSMFYETYELSTNVCEDEFCGEQKEGTSIFDGIDPIGTDNPDLIRGKQDWPLSPGRYVACYEADYRSCSKSFKVEIPNKVKFNIKRKAMVQPTKEVYDYGEDIVADFDLVYAYPNSKVSIIKYVENDLESGDEISWVYTGCNNAYGDQIWEHASSDYCIKTQKDGRIMFTADNTAQYPIDGGDYEMWISYYNGHWFDDIIGGASTRFKINPKPKSTKSPSYDE